MVRLCFSRVDSCWNGGWSAGISSISLFFYTVKKSNSLCGVFEQSIGVLWQERLLLTTNMEQVLGVLVDLCGSTTLQEIGYYSRVVTLQYLLGWLSLFCIRYGWLFVLSSAFFVEEEKEM